MNYSDLIELDDYTEDMLALCEINLDVEPNWHLEQDVLSNCID